MDIFNVDVNNINLDDTNYKEDGPETDQTFGLAYQI